MMIAETKDDWIDEAAQADILQAAISRGANLRRSGREWVGPCPSCGGTDRFAVNPAKRVFLCRGEAGGNVIAMVQHIDKSSFWVAVESLTGRPPPGRQSSETPQERIDREKRVADAKREREERAKADAAEDAADQSKRRQSAAAVWRQAAPIKVTRAQEYLIGRGIAPRFADYADLRFHPDLYNADARRGFPALVALVRDFEGIPIGIWRIWLGDGKKGRAPIENPKKGLGSFRDKGGAVRLGPIAEEIGIAEGIESSCAACELVAGVHPVWAGLTAGGIASFIVPAGVRRVFVYEDADLPKYHAEKGTWTQPAGRRASSALLDRYRNTDVEIIIQSPGINTKIDWVDVLRAVKGLPPE